MAGSLARRTVTRSAWTEVVAARLIQARGPGCEHGGYSLLARGRYARLSGCPTAATSCPCDRADRVVATVGAVDRMVATLRGGGGPSARGRV